MDRIRSAEHGRLVELLVEQRTGVLCAFASAGLLAVGSFVSDLLPEHYAGLAMDDLRFFFRPWRWQHAWLYALLVVLAVWGTSALLCAVSTVQTLWRKRMKEVGSYGPPLLHVAFGAALVAHLWGGLVASTERFVVPDVPTDIHGSQYRTLRMEIGRHPGGMPRSVVAVLERKRGSTVEEVRVGYNRPLISAGGARELLLGQYDSVIAEVVLRHRGQSVALHPGNSVVAGSDRIKVLAVHAPNTNPSLRVPVVELEIGENRKLLALGPEGDGETAFIGFDESPVVELFERQNPSVPLAVLLALLLVAGVGLVVWGRAKAEA